jgi:serine/threonine-protein kinase
MHATPIGTDSRQPELPELVAQGRLSPFGGGCEEAHTIGLTNRRSGTIRDVNAGTTLGPGVEHIGPFRIQRRLSSRFKDVFLAVDDSGRRVVLKVLGPPEREQALLDPRIAEEARTYARLSHPNVVKVVDLFSEGGRFVVALEYIEGSTLNVVYAALSRGHDALGTNCWLYVAACVFAALGAAHAATDDEGRPSPIVHRNINPSNVYVGWDGSVKLGNFSVENVIKVARESSPGIRWGSYGYFAPEQVKVMPVGPYTDVYSATLVLWELLAGRKAIERGDLSDIQLFKIMAEPNILPIEKVRPDTDPRVVELIHTALQPDPSKRTIDAARACAVLRDVIDMEAARASFAAMLAPAKNENPALLSRRQPPRPRKAGDAAPAAGPAPASKVASASDAARMVASADLVASAGSELEGRRGHEGEADGDAIRLSTHDLEDDFGASAAARASRQRAIAAGIIAAVTLLGVVVMGAVVLRLARPASPESEAVAAPAKGGSGKPAAPPSTAAAPFAAAPKTVAAISPASAAPFAAAPKAGPAPAAAQQSGGPFASPAATKTIVAEPAAIKTVATEPPRGAATPANAIVEAHASHAPDEASGSGHTGELQFPRSAAGHRIFIDGHVAGDGKEVIRVACGEHSLRIGSAGRVQQVDVPCGSTLIVTR